MPPHVRSHCALSFEVGPIRLTFVEEVDSFKRPEKHQEDRITWGGNYQALSSDFFDHIKTIGRTIQQPKRPNSIGFVFFYDKEKLSSQSSAKMTSCNETNVHNYPATIHIFR